MVVMGISTEQESWVSFRNSVVEEEKLVETSRRAVDNDDDEGGEDLYDQETEEIWEMLNRVAITDGQKGGRGGGGGLRSSLSSGGMMKMKKKKKSQVVVEGYVEGSTNNDDDLKRAKSLTDDDLDELKGCLDLGFGFNYDEIPELCNTLPALELCYSMSQKFLDDQQKSPDRSSGTAEAASNVNPNPIANWKISSPGDHPEDVKARLKFWAQAVACTVRLCS